MNSWTPGIASEIDARLALLIAAGGAPKLLIESVEEHGTALAALESSSLRARLREGVRKPDVPGEVAKQHAHAAAAGARWVVPGEGGIPTLANAALVCVKGELRSEPGVAVVGSREADAYGRSLSQALGRALAEVGVAVVSGAARGVDEAAHLAAIAAGGRTVAFLGTGIAGERGRDRRALLDAIASSGAVASEYLATASGATWTFPERNRLIAALSAATVVVQAARKSGALHTARHALSLGKPLFAVPGDVCYPLSGGTNDLIASGQARMLVHPRDLIAVTGAKALNHATWPLGVRGGAVPVARNGTGAPLEAGGRVLDLLGLAGPLRFDDLADRLGAEPDLPGVLLDLELRDLVRLGAGGQYERVQ